MSSWLPVVRVMWTSWESPWSVLPKPRATIPYHRPINLILVCLYILIGLIQLVRIVTRSWCPNKKETLLDLRFRYHSNVCESHSHVQPAKYSEHPEDACWNRTMLHRELSFEYGHNNRERHHIESYYLYTIRDPASQHKMWIWSRP